MEKFISGKFAWVGISLLSVVTVVIGIYGFFLQKPVLYGAVYEPPRPVAEIITTDVQGNAFQLSKLRGKVVMAYFGYTHCPLECPLTMAHLKQALASLGSEAEDVRVVMISTDPQRDTPEAMNDFLSRFDTSFLGITGDPDFLSKLYLDFNLIVLEGGETHSSFTYLIDRNGYVRLAYVPDSKPEDIAHDLKIILAEN